MPCLRVFDKSRAICYSVVKLRGENESSLVILWSTNTLHRDDTQQAIALVTTCAGGKPNRFDH
jgi:hypothetical protein